MTGQPSAARFTFAFVGNEVMGAGFRLGGCAVHTPRAGAEPQAFAQALAQAEIVIVDEAVASVLPPVMLDDALAALRPLVVLLAADTSAVDPAERARVLLGVER